MRLESVDSKKHSSLLLSFEINALRGIVVLSRLTRAGVDPPARFLVVLAFWRLLSYCHAAYVILSCDLRPIATDAAIFVAALINDELIYLIESRCSAEVASTP